MPHQGIKQKSSTNPGERFITCVEMFYGPVITTLFSDGRRVVGARALGRVARACSIVSCVAGRCCLLGSTPLSTIRSVCHMISTNQPIGRCATDKAVDPSGRCRSGRRFVLQQRLTFIPTSFNVGSLQTSYMFLRVTKQEETFHDSPF